MTVTKKLSLGFGGTLAAMLAFAYSSFTSISGPYDRLDEAVNSEAKKLDLTRQLLRELTDMDASQRSVAWRASIGDPGGVQKLLQSDEERRSTAVIKAAVSA